MDLRLLFKLLFNMQKVLFIDTSSNKEIKVGIKKGGKSYFLKQKINSQKAQIALPMIDKLLKQHSVSLKDLTSIKVNTRHGSFTGVRVGMAIANALAFVLKIPASFIK